MQKNKVSKRLRKEKIQSPHYIPKKKSTPPNKKPYTNSLPKYITTLIDRTEEIGYRRDKQD